MEKLDNSPYIDEQFDKRFSEYSRTYSIIEKTSDLVWWMVDGNQYLMQLCCVRATFNVVIRISGMAYRSYDDYIWVIVPTKVIK